jgi:hypothetical protein
VAYLSTLLWNLSKGTENPWKPHYRSACLRHSSDRSLFPHYLKEITVRFTTVFAPSNGLVIPIVIQSHGCLHEQTASRTAQLQTVLRWRLSSKCNVIILLQKQDFPHLTFTMYCSRSGSVPLSRVPCTFCHSFIDTLERKISLKCTLRFSSYGAVNIPHLGCRKEKVV